MDNKEFGKQLEKRTLSFGVAVLKLSGKLPNSQEGRVVRNQVSKSGTSVGANYREANRSRSKADFKNKIRISEGEASETIYWLLIIKEMEWVPANLIEPMEKECSELLAIFTSISQKLNSK
ncbi:MAG: four helix bundle protein [Flavobacteriales bacterium]